jgi:hypothetical protein
MGSLPHAPSLQAAASSLELVLVVGRRDVLVAVGRSVQRRLEGVTRLPCFFLRATQADVG